MMNENIFWLGLFHASNQELARHADADLPDQIVRAIESILPRIKKSADDDWFFVEGFENPQPVAVNPTLNAFIFGVLFGNYMAWRCGVNFYHENREKH